MNLLHLTVRLVPYEDFYNDDAGENLARFCLIVECFEGGYEFCGSTACVVQSRCPDCLADGERCSSINSGDHGVGAD